MPARKLVTLMNSHDSKKNRDERGAAEKIMTLPEKLTTNPPRALRFHKVASSTWKKIIKLYLSVEGQIVTLFDEETIIQFCLLIEEIPWMAGIRDSVEVEYKAIEKQVSKNRSLKVTDESYKNYLHLLEQYGAILARLQGLDARLDGKRKLIHSLSQSLYLTPRSRAGVAPPEKIIEIQSEMEKLLSE
jgi:hypothetical protein